MALVSQLMVKAVEYEELYPIDQDPPDPFSRPRINDVLSVGVKSLMVF